MSEVTPEPTPSEQVPGLQPAPGDGKWEIRLKARTADQNPNAPYQPRYQLVLIVEGEEEYTTDLPGIEDGNITSSAFQLINLRRERQRANLVEQHQAVEVTPL